MEKKHKIQQPHDCDLLPIYGEPYIAENEPFPGEILPFWKPQDQLVIENLNKKLDVLISFIEEEGLKEKLVAKLEEADQKDKITKYILNEFMQ